MRCEIGMCSHGDRIIMASFPLLLYSNNVKYFGKWVTHSTPGDNTEGLSSMNLFNVFRVGFIMSRRANRAGLRPILPDMACFVLVKEGERWVKNIAEVIWNVESLSLKALLTTFGIMKNLRLLGISKKLDLQFCKLPLFTKLFFVWNGFWKGQMPKLVCGVWTLWTFK